MIFELKFKVKFSIKLTHQSSTLQSKEEAARCVGNIGGSGFSLAFATHPFAAYQHQNPITRVIFGPQTTGESTGEEVKEVERTWWDIYMKLFLYLVKGNLQSPLRQLASSGSQPACNLNHQVFYLNTSLNTSISYSVIEVNWGS